MSPDHLETVPTENNAKKRSSKKHSEEKRRAKMEDEIMAQIKKISDEVIQLINWLPWIIAIFSVLLIITIPGFWTTSTAKTNQTILSFEDLPVEWRNVFEELEAANSNLKVQLKMENMRIKNTEENILTAIVGSWEMVSSVGVDRHLEEYKKRYTFTPIELAALEVGDIKLEFDVNSQTLTSYDSIGSQELEKQQYKIGELLKFKGRLLYSMSVEDNRVNLAFVDRRGEEFTRTEMFMKEGYLNVVDKRFGLTSTKIYKKMDKSEKSEH